MKPTEFITEMKEHLRRGRNIIIFSGNIYDQFPYEGEFLPLPDCLTHDFKKMFSIVQFDAVNGFSGNLSMFERASFDPATSEFRANEYDKLNAQINTLPNQVPKIDRALKQKDYRIMIIIPLAQQVFNKNSLGPERFCLERWASQPVYSASGNVLVLLTRNPGELPLESGSNCATIQINLPEEKEIEYLIMTRNALNGFNLFTTHEYKECVQLLVGLSYREIATIIKAKQTEPKHSFKDIAEEFRYGSQKTNSIEENIKSKVLTLEKHLLDIIKGQDEAIKRISKAIAGRYFGIENPEGPLVIFCLGQTGIGKSQTPKEVAKCLFGNENRLVPYNMNEYMNESDAYRLLGSPPGYIGHTEGSSLANAVRNNPYAIFLFDEMEKSHWRIQDAFLGIMSDGFLRDNQDNIVSFKKTIIFLTSNILTRESLYEKFRSEFINRLSFIVQYTPLSKEACKEILESKLQRVTQDAAKKDLTLQFTNEAKRYLLDNGFDPRCNAREVNRVVKKEINDKVTELIINGSIKKGAVINFDASENEGLKISIKNNNNL